MTVKLLGRLRVGILILTGLFALAGIFPGLMFAQLGRDPTAVARDDFYLVGAVYAMTFLLIFVWLILVALERRLRAGDAKTLEDS